MSGFNDNFSEAEAVKSLQGLVGVNFSLAVSSYNNIVSARPGWLEGISFNDGKAMTTVLYDATLSAGGNITTLATLDAPAKGFLPFPTTFVNGFSISATSACNVTVFYR